MNFLYSGLYLTLSRFYLGLDFAVAGRNGTGCRDGDILPLSGGEGVQRDR